MMQLIGDFSVFFKWEMVEFRLKSFKRFKGVMGNYKHKF